MKAAVVCQPLSKFGMFTFVISYTMPLIVIFSLNGWQTKILDFWWEKPKRGTNFKGEIGNPSLNETMVQR